MRIGVLQPRELKRGVVQTVFPLIVVLLGLAVFIMVVAYFMPLIQLIRGMTDS